MKQLTFILAVLLTLTSCDDDYTVPDLRQDLCLFTYRGTGFNSEFTIDAGQSFVLSTPLNLELKTDTAYRMLITYAIDADDPRYTSLYQLQQVPLLTDSTDNLAKCDTLTNVQSVWQGGGFVNLALQFKHDGRDLRQSFGYRIDRVEHNGKHARHHLSLFFRQNGVLEYYTSTYNFSLRPSDLGAEQGDTITLHTVTKSTMNGSTSVNFDKFDVYL